MKKTRESALRPRELWIGLAKLEPSTLNGVLEDAKGAYTNAIGIASDRVGFRVKVKDALAELDLRLIRLEQAAPLKARLSENALDSELTKVARVAGKTGKVGFGTFHAFEAR